MSESQSEALISLYVILGGATTLLLTGFLFRRSFESRKQELEQVAASAKENRDNKVHSVLLNGNGHVNQGFEQLSGREINKKALNGSLDIPGLIIELSQRCSRYGRSEAINAITEEFYDEAYERAQMLHRQSKKQGLLFGVPISVKDCIGKRGALSTGGLACRAYESLRGKDDSLIVNTLQNEGAIVLVRGNVPQSMLLPESQNNIFGKTTNPWNRNRTCGGSSGGEGALVAMRCVPLAVGTDIGGSVRIPAAFCGVVGFKPTADRISRKGCMVARVNNRNGLGLTIPSVIGPIAKTVDDCAQFMKAVWSPFHFERDSNIPPMEFKSDVYTSDKPLRIGYFKSDGWFEPCSAAVRGLEQTIEALERAGHTMIEFPPPTTGWESYPLYLSLIGADGNMRSIIEGLEGEPLIKLYHKVQQAANIPNILRPLIAQVLDERRSRFVMTARSGGISAYDFWQRSADLIELRRKWDEAIMESGVDVIIHPTLPLPAYPHGMSANLTSSLSYTMLANLLLWPSGTCPVTLVGEDEQDYDIEALPANQRDEFAGAGRRVMEDSEGLPISVAVLARRFEDELCLRAMKEIEKAVRFGEEPQDYTSV